MRAEKKVTLMWGLPGSGKTYYADATVENRSGFRRNPVIVDVDEYRRYGNYSAEKVVTLVANDVVRRLASYPHVIVDGLITTNQTARNLMLEISTHPENKFVTNFEIVWFERDVESCKHNDRGRRSVNSTITIENIPFEEPSKELAQEFNIPAERIIKKLVVRKPEWVVWAQENTSAFDRNSRTLKSDTWRLGGTVGSCWDSEKRPVSAGEQPASFKEFDDLLTKVCPTIHFLQYKKLYAETVTTEDSGQGDYYGGYINYRNFVCDLEKLYGMLDEMGLIVPRETL